MGSKLTDLFVKTAGPGVYRDAGCSTLTLRVTKAGTRQWVQQLTVHGRERGIGLGGYPLVSLSEARKRTTDNRALARAGGDPCALKQKVAVPMFAAALDEVIAIHRDGWKDGGKSERQWRSSVETYASKRLGKMRVDQISTADIMAVLLPHWQAKHETMRRVRQRIGAVMQWAVAQGYRQDNPAGDAISAALPKPAKPRSRQRALPYPEVAAAIETVRGSNRAHWATKSCFEFMALTAARSGEARAAQWGEVDLDGRTWTVPAERMKMKREHRVPLSGRVVTILQDAAALADGSGLVFPSATGRTMSDNTLSKLLRENGIAAVPHGFRSSFRVWAEERTDAPRSVCEAALAHTVGGVEGAYLRTDLFERRRALMDAWAEYLG